MHLLLLVACGEPVVSSDYLALINVAPAHGAANIGVDTRPHATFNDALVSGSWEGAVWLEEPNGSPVIAELAYDPDTWTLELIPAEDLLPDQRYAMVIEVGVEGEAFGPLLAGLSSEFRTAGAVPIGGGNQPPVALIDGESCAVGESVALDGSDSFDPDGDALSFSWRVASGAGASVNAPNADLTALTAEQPGEVVVGLVVNDGLVDSDEAFLRLDCN